QYLPATRNISNLEWKWEQEFIRVKVEHRIKLGVTVKRDLSKEFLYLKEEVLMAVMGFKQLLPCHS
ncbi:hypothetical protein HMPREF1028_02290, partial [Neisseria sp. GT4A_CT1]